MRIQDLKIGNGSAPGIYTRIQSLEDYNSFLSLCKKYHHDHLQSAGINVYTPTEENIRMHSAIGCVAYVSSFNGVVGVASLNEIQKLGYVKMHNVKHMLHDMVKSYKE